MAMLQITKNDTSERWLMKSFLLAILGTLLAAWLFIGCDELDMNNPMGYIDIWRVAEKVIPATVYIEVINRHVMCSNNWGIRSLRHGT